MTATPNALQAGGGSVSFVASAADGSALENITWQYVPDSVGADSVPLAAARAPQSQAGAIRAEVRTALERGDVYTLRPDHELVKGRPAGGGIFFVKLPVGAGPKPLARGLLQPAAKTSRNAAAVAGSACAGSTTCTETVTQTGSMVVQATIHGQALSAMARVQVGASGPRPPIPPKVVITPAATGMLAPKGLGGDYEVLDISVVDSAGARLPGRTVTLTLKAEEGTAGHAHTGNKPPGAVDAQGEESVVTGADGWAHVMYQAPAVSGAVEVHGTSDSATAAVDTIEVGVAGLVALAPGATYTLIGWRAEHPDNHFGTPQMLADLRALADSLSLRAAVYARFPDSIRGTSRFPSVLGINDISLTLGGVFDLDLNWRPPHEDHSVGRSADLDVRRGTDDDDYAAAVQTIWEVRLHHRVGDERSSRNHLHASF